MSRSEYVLDTAEETERQRLAAQTEVWDPFTCVNLHKVGVGAGWRCLEAGGGTGSVASWLGQRVGDSGHVVVTDIETRWLESLAGPNLEVRRHDIVVDPLETASYDLIHARLLLEHLPERSAVLVKLAEALRPGGWLVVEDYDLHTLLVSHPPNPTFPKVGSAIAAALASAGVDVNYGRKLPAALLSVGLADISVEGRVLPQRAAEAGRYGLAVIERLKDRIISSGLATAAELDEVMGEMSDDESSQWGLSPILVSARGRRKTGEHRSRPAGRP